MPSKPNWSSYLLPSVSDLLFLMLLFSFSAGVLAPRLLQDADTGWHIRNGEMILATHHIPHTDSFSSTMQGKPWYAWEWLYDAMIASLHTSWGLNGVVYFTAFVIALTFALSFRLVLARGGGFVLTLFLLLFSLGAAAIHMLARPHVLSWLLTVVWFHLLQSSESHPPNRRLFWLPPLMLLWVNVHGGFLTGFILLALYFLGNLLEFAKSTSPGHRAVAAHRLRSLGTISALCLIASLINPYGYKLYAHIYHYLSNHYLMTHIEEFQSPNFHALAPQCFLLLVLITVVLLATRRVQPATTELLLILFAVASGFYASRNLPVSALLLMLVVAPLARESGEGPVSGLLVRVHAIASRMGNTERNLRGHLWPAVGLLAGIAICAHGGKLGSRQLMTAHFSEPRFPVRAVDIIAQHPGSGPVLAPDNWGGYLIYRLYPQVKVVADDRHDLYGQQFFTDYSLLLHVEPGWEELLKQHNAGWVLVPETSPLDDALGHNADWSVEYGDSTAVLLKKK
jgi:hypothetical protein